MSDVAAPAAPETYKIPAERIEILANGVEKLNRRATKLGFAPVVLIASAPRPESYKSSEPGFIGQLRTRWVIDVRFEGEAPRIQGYGFQAALTHTPQGNLVSRAPGVETDLSGWRETGARCQHCGLDRRRAETFLLQSPEGGIVQIGRQCLVDYIGTTDVTRAVQLWRVWRELVSGITDEDGEYGFGGGWMCPTTPVEFLAAAVSSVKRRGFVKSQCADQQTSTRAHAEWILGPEPKLDDRHYAASLAEREEWRVCQPTEAHTQEAQAIIDWVLASNDSSDYMHNARVGCGARTMMPRTAGLLASLPSAYDKHLGKVYEKKQRPAAGPHVGTVGERIDATITVRFEMMIAGDPDRRFSVSKALLIMVDEHNSAFKTFASGELKRVEKLKEGTWHMRGTVKSHEADKKTGEPVTVLKRVELQREPFPQLKPAKPRKVHPSKGKPIRMYDLPWCSERATLDGVATFGHLWKCPEHVAFDRIAALEGDQLNIQSCRQRLQRAAGEAFGF